MADPISLIIPAASALLGVLLSSWNSQRVARQTVAAQRDSDERRRLDSALEGAYHVMMRAREANTNAVELEYSDPESGGMLTEASEHSIHSAAWRASDEARQRFNDLQYHLGPGDPVIASARDLLEVMAVRCDHAWNCAPMRPDHVRGPTEEEENAARQRMQAAETAFENAVQAARPRARSQLPAAPTTPQLPPAAGR